MVFQNRSHLFFQQTQNFPTSSTNPAPLLLIKPAFIPLLEENPFEYMFLRPRRWGKSTFLNMLAAYYDVKTKDLFKEIFGGLHIGKAPTKFRNSHLILLFDFSSITAIGSLERIERSIFDNISGSLRRFLLKYQDILGDALPEEYIIPGRTGASLTNVLVSKFGAGVYCGTERDNRISFTEMAIPLSLASTSMSSG